MAQGHVDPVAAQVDQRRRGFHAHLDLRVALVETAQARHQPRGGKGGDRADGERLAPSHVFQRLAGAGDLRKGTQQGGVDHGARFGQAQALAFARKQGHADPFFQQADLLADGARRHVQRFGGGLDAAALAHFDKGAQCLER
ncbi:hypothetical protein D3C72_1360710 [compost metagenome]